MQVSKKSTKERIGSMEVKGRIADGKRILSSEKFTADLKEAHERARIAIKQLNQPLKLCKCCPWHKVYGSII